MKKVKNLKLSPPWITFFKELRSIFAEDPEVKAVFDYDENTINIYVDNSDKAEAMANILPEEKVFGNVTVKINVVPSNNPGDKFRDDLKTAFCGNPALVDIETVVSPLGTFTYAIWAKEVVQFFDDNLSDIHGVKSTLYEQIARDVFKEKPGLYHCTDI